MIRKILSILVVLTLSILTVQANISKVAVVDVQKVVAKSAQVKALKKEEEAKRKALADFIKQAGENIKKEQNIEKKKTLANKYEKELQAKREANAKTYSTKLEAIDKSINASIIQQAKAMGYDMVLTKGVVLYGGDDITEAILKVVK